INRHPGQGPFALDHPQSAVEVGAGFLMNQYVIGSGLDEHRSITVGIFDHQVYIQLQLRHLPDGLHNWRAERKIGYKMTVHDIDMEYGGACPFDGSDLLTQPRKIRRKNRRKDLNHFWRLLPEV